MDNKDKRVEADDHISSPRIQNHKQNNQQQQQQQSLIDNEDEENDHHRSFLLIDENELMQVESAEEFADKLGCNCTALVKVVSIFGSIGHGKSYTLNHTFFGSQEVFETSSSQDSCTIGIWAAYDEKRRVITLDTEGLLGVSANCQRRTRLLLKVLAISDLVIYRTRSERLEDNLFTFLGDASRVYVQHFSKEMKNAFQRLPELNGHSISELGPVVIIFQETRDTEPLKSEGGQSRESIIRSRFKTLGLTVEAFSAIEYVGIQTLVRPTNFDQLKVCIKRHIKNSSARTPRPISVVYATLRTLNEKFNGNIEKTVPSMFPNQYLTCPTTCLSCNARCTNSMNHHRDGLGHQTDAKCVYQHQFNNHILYCRACHERGETVFVTPKTCSSNESPWVGLAKYAWAGYVLECPRCGVIHRNRQYWFGNKDNWESTVRTEIKHVWPGELNKMQAAQNAAQRVLDSVNYITETVTTISAKPTKMVSEWVADQIAPNYWIPNSMILHCALCNAEFGQYDQKHHCRLCGNGLCSTCSSKSKPVPERGWGEMSVRVCDRCYERSDNLTAINSLPPLPPMLMQMQGNSSSTNNTNGYIVKSSQSCNDIQQKLMGNKNSSTPSNSIPIPANRSVGCSSNNITPTPHSSSSIGSSSSGSNNHQLINEYTATTTNNSPAKQNGSLNDSGSNQPLLDLVSDSPLMMMNTCSQQSSASSSSHLNGNDCATAGGGGGGCNSTITARKLGEVLQSTIKTVVSTAIDYPLGVIKDSARPDYWLPDSQIANCGLCKKDFNEQVAIHHCRRCGGGFCHECSTKSMPVPERGWGDASVRVCDKCYELK
uniref:Zinc finger FYVE domain-containing protein 1 n=1 Tax=Aceria tosichella TaxID=561515 RepID=A0A6G1SGL5_9ACAR